MMQTSKGKREKSAYALHNRRTMIAIIFVVCLLILFLFVRGRILKSKINAGQQKKQELEQMMEQEKQRTEEIKALNDYMQSDEYLEKEAKDKLGLVKDGDIIFKENK